MNAARRRVTQRIIEKGETPKQGHAGVKQYAELYGITITGKISKYLITEYSNPESLIYKDTSEKPNARKKTVIDGKGKPTQNKIDERRLNYESYMKSNAWQLLRSNIIAKRGRKCEKCGETKGEIHAHHLNYERFMNELPEDIQLLCKACHMAVHKRRNNKKEKRKLAKASQPKKPKKQKKSKRPQWDKTPNPLEARWKAVRAKYAGIKIMK